MAPAPAELAERSGVDGLKVAVLCPYDLGLPGGVQQVTIELTQRLEAAGHDAWLVGPGLHRGARSVGRTVRIRANASVVPVALGPGVIGRVARAVDGADVVHVHEPLMPLVSLAALRSSSPLVATFHADPPRWVAGVYSTAGWLLRSRLRRAVVTAVSPTAAAALPPSWGPVELIPNALDVASYATGDVRVRGRVTFLGRADPRKGLDVALAAWPAVHDAFPAAELIVMGSSATHPAAGVRYVGRVSESEKRSLLSSAMLHVAPNVGGESFGIVVAEAMAAGAAVVASDLPAFQHVIGDGGVLVPTGDAEALAREMIRLLADPAETMRLGAVAVERAQTFDWSVVLDRYLAAYRRAVG